MSVDKEELSKKRDTASVDILQDLHDLTLCHYVRRMPHISDKEIVSQTGKLGAQESFLLE